MIAGATRSTTFSGHASVAEIWASLPGFPTPRDIFGHRARCLTLEAVHVAGDDRDVFQRLARPTHAVFVFADVDLDALPRTHPSVERVERAGEREGILGGRESIVTFPRADGSLRPLHEVGSRPFYDEPFGRTLVVRPKVGTQPIGPPSEFLTLWALLFCLSELARYYPNTWVRALDPDRSSAAVTLEHGLDLALQRAPALIADALRGPIPILAREELRQQQAQQAAGGVVAEEPA